MDHHTIKKQHALLYRTDDGLVDVLQGFRLLRRHALRGSYLAMPISW